MKILIITDYLAPQTHGIAVRMEKMIYYLRKFNHNVTVYGSKHCSTSDEILPSVNLPQNNDVNICIPTFALLYDICVNNYDIIHLVYPPCLTGFSLFLLFLLFPIFHFIFGLRTKIVTSNHVNLLEYKKTHYNYFTGNVMHIIYILFICLPQLYISNMICSPSEYCDMNEIFGKSDNFKVLRFGVDTELFKYSNSKRRNVLLYVGRISNEKNLDNLVYKFIEFNSLVLNKYELWIVGFGPYEDELKLIVGNYDYIKFFGKKSHEELPFYYYQAKAHINISISETLGLTLLESISCGTPIIYANCDVFNNLYKNDFPELCYTGDLLANVSYIENNEYLIQQKCKEFIKDYTWENAARHLEKLYESIL